MLVCRIHSIYCMYIYKHGKQEKSRPRKKWLDNVWEDGAARNMTLCQAVELARNRSTYRNIVWAAGAQGLRHCRKDLPCKSIVFYGESLYYRATNCRRVPVRLLQVGVLLK